MYIKTFNKINNETSTIYIKTFNKINNKTINISMKHGAKNRSNTRKILNNNNIHTHTRMVLYVHKNRPGTPAEARCGYIYILAGRGGGGP